MYFRGAVLVCHIAGPYCTCYDMRSKVSGTQSADEEWRESGVGVLVLVDGVLSEGVRGGIKVTERSGSQSSEVRVRGQGHAGGGATHTGYLARLG